MKIKIKEHRENPSAGGRARGSVPVRAEAASGHPLWKLCFSSLNCIFFVFVSLFLEFTTIQLFNFVHSSCASDFLLYPLMIHSLDHTRRQGSCSGIRIAFAMLGLPSLQLFFRHAKYSLFLPLSFPLTITFRFLSHIFPSLLPSLSINRSFLLTFLSFEFTFPKHLLNIFFLSFHFFDIVISILGCKYIFI